MFGPLSHYPENTPFRPITPHARRPWSTATLSRVDRHRRLRDRRHDLVCDQLTRRLSVNDCGQRVGAMAERHDGLAYPDAAGIGSHAAGLSVIVVQRGLLRASFGPASRSCRCASRVFRPDRLARGPAPTLSRMLGAKNPAHRGGRMRNCFANVESTRLSRQTRRLIVPRLFHLLQPPAIRRRFIFIVEVRNPRTESRRPTAMPGNRRIVNLTSRMNVRISEYCLILTSSALHNVQMRICRAIDHLISDRSHCLCSSHAASVMNCMTGSPTGE